MMNHYDVLCIGTALIDSIIRGFDDQPVSASGYRAEASSLHVGCVKQILKAENHHKGSVAL